jgi:hypothetical protein
MITLLMVAISFVVMHQPKLVGAPVAQKCLGLVSRSVIPVSCPGN